MPRTTAQDFHDFMLMQRYDHVTCPVDEIRHAFECGWECGYDARSQEARVIIAMFLCGMLFLMLGAIIL